ASQGADGTAAGAAPGGPHPVSANPHDEPGGDPRPAAVGPRHWSGGADAATAGDHGHRWANGKHAVYAYDHSSGILGDGEKKAENGLGLVRLKVLSGRRDALASLVAGQECLAYPMGNLFSAANGKFEGVNMISLHNRTRVAGFFAVLLSAAGADAQSPSLELKQKITLLGKAGNLDHLALDAKRDRLLVANKANNTLDVVDLKTGKL